jgi:hypothetical protein
MGYDRVHAFSPAGQRVGQIHLPDICSNVCSGGPRRNRLFMTANRSLYVVYFKAQGEHWCWVHSLDRGLFSSKEATGSRYSHLANIRCTQRLPSPRGLAKQVAKSGEFCGPCNRGELAGIGSKLVQVTVS